MPSDSAPSDAQVLRQVRSGDHSAYSVIVSRHQVRVLGLCRSMLRDDGDADDAAQECFIKAFRALGDFRGESSFSTWLYRIVYNHCLNQIGKTSRSRAMIDEYSRRTHAAPLQPSDDEGADFMAREALAVLPVEQSVVLALRLQGLDYEGIAASLDISLDAVKSRLKRAREYLRGHYQIERAGPEEA